MQILPAHLNLIPDTTVRLGLGFQTGRTLERMPESSHEEGNMEPVISREVRQLCKAVSEEQEPSRAKILMDQLLDLLNERMLMASLF